MASIGLLSARLSTASASPQVARQHMGALAEFRRQASSGSTRVPDRPTVAPAAMQRFGNRAANAARGASYQRIYLSDQTS